MARFDSDGRLYEVYLHRSKKTGKAYVGFTCQGMRTRLLGHESAARAGSSAPFHRALRRYGIEGFESTVIASCFGYDAATQIEIALIAEFGAYGQGGYNATTGGEGTRGTKQSAQRRAEISKQFCELPRTEQHKRRISEALSGRPKMSLRGRPSKSRGRVQDLVERANSLAALAKAKTVWEGRNHNAAAKQAMRDAKSRFILLSWNDGRIETRKTTLGAIAAEYGISKPALSKAMIVGRSITKDCGLKGCRLQFVDG